MRQERKQPKGQAATRKSGFGGSRAWPAALTGGGTARAVALGVLVLALLASAQGCGWGAKSTSSAESAKGAGKPPAQAQTKVVTLYFADAEGLNLLPEEREVTLAGASLPEVVVQELIKGPRLAGHYRTVPEGTQLRGIEVRNGVAYVNFSREFQTRHWGGSTGEAFTLYSVINSLARLEGIEKVQFLLEGEVQEAILGHADTTKPLAPNWEIVKN